MTFAGGFETLRQQGSSGGGGGTPVTGLTGTPTQVVYIDNAGNGTGDALFTRDSTTLDTTIFKSYGTDVTGGLTMTTAEEALLMLNSNDGSVSGFFNTNTGGILSSDMGWTDGALATAGFIAAPGVATMSVSDGSDVSSITVNAAQSIAKGKLFKIDSPFDRTLASFNTQSNLIEMGDLTTNYSGSTLTFNTDTNTAEFNLDVKGGATTIVSNFNMNPTDGNLMTFVPDTGDTYITKLVQSIDLLGAGVLGTAINYSKTGTPNSATVLVGDFTSLGGGAYSAALVADNGTTSGRVFADSANGVLNIFDDVDYANTFSSRFSATATDAQLSYEDITNTITTQVFTSPTEAVIGYRNAALESTSINVRDKLIIANVDGVFTVQDGSASSIAYIDAANRQSIFGSVSNTGGIKMFIDDAVGINVQAPNAIINVGANTFGNETNIQVDDSIQAIKFGYAGDDYTFPIGDGAAGQLLTTNGTGQLAWVDGGMGSFALDVRVATTAVLPGSPTYNNGASGVGATLTRGTNGTLGTIDGITSFTIGDRILVKNQSSQLQNGVYEVTTVGSVSVPYVLTRTVDADTTAALDDMVVIPSAGTTNKSSSFGQQTQNPTIGTNNIVFSVVASVFIKQQTSGTQVANQIPIYTSTALTLTKGTSNFTYNPTAKRLVLDATTANVLIGPFAGDTSTLTNSIFIGSSAGETITNSGAEGSIGIGTSAGASATGEGNMSFGYQSGGATTGDNNINVGIRAGTSNTADYGVNIGYEAGLYNSGGGSMNGLNSVFIGKSAGSNAVNGLNSIFIGKDAGKNDTVDNSVSGTSILIGDTTSTGGFKNSIAIGAGATNTAVNQLMIGSSGSNITDIRWQGILTSSDMHNNALAQGSATAQQVRSGTYTPTLTAVTNVTATTARKCQWMRVGNVVTVSGQMDIDPTATGTTVVGISLPVASNFGTAFEAGGAGHAPTLAGHGAAIYADATNNRAELSYVDSVGSNDTMTFTFTYEVI